MGEMYYKTTLDLTSKELALVYDADPNGTYPMAFPVFTKKGLIMNILAIQPTFFNDVDKKYYFRKTGSDLKYEPDFTGEAPQKKAREDHKINVTEINEHIEMESLNQILAKIEQEDAKIKDEPNETPNQQQQNSPPKEEKRESPKNPKVNKDQQVRKQKIPGSIKPAKYDSSLPIDSFLSQMEIYQQCQNLPDTDLIGITLSQMMNDETGISIRRALKADEMTSWTAFKKKLTAILGRSKEHFRHQLRTYQRGQDTCGVALAKLTDYFMQAYDRTELSESENDMLVELFINAMEPRLKQLLSREKSALTYDNIIARAAELERSITPLTQEGVFATLDRSFLENQINLLRSEIKDAQEKKKPARKRVDVRKMEGHCISYTRSKKCKRNPCKYIHSDDPPQSVIDAVNNAQ